MLEILKKKRQEGFTLVELLIVIVIIAILAALVIVTFSGVQQRARNTERQTDVAALAKFLEVYYTNGVNGVGGGNYPTQASIITPVLPDTVKANFFPGLDTNALAAPQVAANTNSLVGAASANKDQYGYQAWQTDGTTACGATAANCQKYTLSWWEENGTSNPLTKKSAN